MTDTINYTARDATTIRAELQRVIKETAPDLWNDFNTSNLGSVLIDLIALTGDTLSFGQDVIAQEMFLSTAQRYESAIRKARDVGYKPRAAIAAAVTVRSTSMPGQLTTYGGIIKSGSSVTGANGLNYEVTTDTVISPGAGYIRVPMKEGKSYQEIFKTTSQPRMTITLTNTNVEEITWTVTVSVSGTPVTWTQVDNVALELSATNTYQVFLDGNNKATFTFGDGVAGAIPPGDITIAYRTTSGSAGNSGIGTIRGTLQAIVNSDGSTVPVPVENTDTINADTGGSLFISGEPQSLSNSTSTETVFNQTLQNSPLIAGSLTLTIYPTGNVTNGALILKDTANGTFTILLNTTGSSYAITASGTTGGTINYTTGAWTFTLTTGSLNFSGTVKPSFLAGYYASAAPAVSAVITTGAASGGQDRETIDQLRVNIPAYIRSRGTLVTLQDYKDALSNVAGVGLVVPDLWIGSHVANTIRLSLWSQESVAFLSESPTQTLSSSDQNTVYYDRYLRATSSAVYNVAQAIRNRNQITVRPAITTNGMRWVDLYFEPIKYDTTYAKSQIRTAITSAIVSVFENADGLSVYTSDIYNAVNSVDGVSYFKLSRLAYGNYNATSADSENIGATSASTSVSGAVANPTVVPGTLTITVNQPSGATVLQDTNGDGLLHVTSGSLVLTTAIYGTANYIDYNTGIWNVSFNFPSGTYLTPNQLITATYRDVIADMRSTQVVKFGVTNDNVYAGDAYPPPTINSIPGYPSSMPPFKDGRPLYPAVPVSSSLSIGSLLTYGVLQDIITPLASQQKYYNDAYLYNGEIFYDSQLVSQAPRAINLRRLVFDLAPK
jgi:hypothetical protein